MESYGNPGSPVHLTPVLMDSQIQRLSEAAELLAQSLPQFEPRPQNSKKRISKELELVMSMAREDPKRMEELRKYAAIYGRFDCKRKPEKPLTLHEVSVNEAAAQICRHIPALLTRRDELFPLARQVVRDSGYQYSKGHAKLELSTKFGKLCNGDEMGIKRPRLENDETQKDGQWNKRQERLEQITEELKTLADKGEELRNKYSQTDTSSIPALQQQMDSIQIKQQQLILEKSELLKHQKRVMLRFRKGSEYERPDTDDTDSQFSMSETSSPQGHDPGENSGDSGTASKIPKQLLQEALMDEGLRVVKEMVGYPKDSPSPSQATNASAFSPYPRVIATSGSSVIAVANPALAMSPYETQDRSPHSSISALVNLSRSVGHEVQVKSEPPEIKQETSRDNPL